MEQIHCFAEEQIKLGRSLQYLTKGLHLFKQVILSTLRSSTIAGNIHETKLYQEIQAWIDPIIDKLIDEYTGSWEQTSQLQRLALKERSVSLIPVFAGISVRLIILY
jgi:rsbT co-antagonist protein RsbR